MKFPRLNIRALAVGLVIMLVLDIVLGFAVLLAWPGAVSSAADLDALTRQPTYLLVAFALGTWTTAMGGSVCARLAPNVPYWHAAVFGVLSIGLGLYMTDASRPFWYTAMAVLVTIPAAVYGAHVGLKRHRQG